MGMEVDRLEIAIQAEATKANAELEKLIGKLGKVSSALTATNSNGLRNFANGISQLSKSMQSMSGVKTTDFNRLANGLNKLGGINTSGLYKSSNALRNFTNTMNGMGSVSDDAVKLATVANGISKLGGASVQKAIVILPQLSVALKNFMTTLSTSPNVSQNIINMTNAMANLASQGSKYGSTIKSMSSATKTLTKSNSTATSSFKSSKSALTSLTAQVWKLYAAYFAVRRVIGFVGDSIKKSMDFTETINLFQTSFKKIGMEEAESMGMEWGSSSADAFAKGYIDRAQSFNDKLTSSLGLDPNTMMNYQAVFAQMSNSMGLVTDSAMNISESFTMLGNDIASLWNIDTKSAMQKLQSGLAGQIRPLRQLGIDISQTSLQMTAHNHGIDDSVIKMSQAAKVQLRWLSVMEQAEVAFGDMAKTIDSPANQLRILKQQWDLLSRAIGNVFLPVIQTILPFVNAVVIALRNMINTLATAMGYELPDYTDSNIYTDATTDIDGMTEGIDDATKANEKLKKSMYSGDELNILSSGSGPSGSGGVDSGSGYGVLDDAIQQKTDSYMKKFNEELANMENKSKLMAENIQAFFKSIGEKTEPTTTALKNLWDNGLSKFMTFVGTDIINWYEKFLIPVGTWALGEGLPSLFTSVNNLLTSIDWASLNSSLGNLYSALAPFAISIGIGLVSFIQSITGIITPLLASTVSLLSTGLSGLATSIGLIPQDVAIALGGAIGGIATAFLIYTGATAVAGTIKSIGVAMGAMLTTLAAHPVLLLAAGIAALAGAVLALDEANFDSSSVGEYIKKVNELTASSVLLNAEIQAMLDKQEERKSGIETEYGAIQILAEKYLALAGQAALTNAQQVLMKSYADELIKAVPELSGLIDKQTGAYNGTKGEIEALITKTKEYYLVQAAQESLIEIAKSQYTAEKKLKDLTVTRQEVGDKLTTAQNALNTAIQESSVYGESAATTAKKVYEAHQEYDRTIGELEKSLAEIDTQIATTTTTQSTLSDEWDYASEYITTYSTDAKTAMDKVEKAVSDAYKNIKVAVKDWKLPDLIAAVKVDSSALTTFMNSQNGGNVVGSSFDKYKINSHATGGYPTPGQLFVANEPGNPELIGNVGGRTAVMNNNQIVEAVSQGVAVAVASVMGGGSQPIYIENVWRTDSETLYTETQKGKMSADRRYHVVAQPV